MDSAGRPKKSLPVQLSSPYVATTMTDPTLRFVAENTVLLRQLTSVLQDIPAEVYCQNGHDFFSSGIGKHIRHVLDFYEKLFESDGQVVDYDARKRDERIEVDPLFALDRTESYLQSLSQFAASTDPGSVTVRIETSGGGDAPAEVGSTVDRELAYVACHTVHHFAIIGILLRIQGLEPPNQFGLAPATVRYNQSQYAGRG